MLLVALLVFAFLYSHGVSLDGVRGHTDTAADVLTPGVDLAVTESTSDDHHGEGHGSSHSAEECATSAPPQQPTLAPPAEHALTQVLPAVPAAAPDANPVPAPASGSSRPPGTTAILRI
ncbi:hypothetical protein ADK49_12830 [Streptomyces sp. WM6349]|uniref:Secreted protein n=1 Tax=Streptomyces antibioticus TaxID=1890 RepID=A0ABX3LPZ8_STRAT|nr:hypothetical protein ADK49_12830 [Streptomyces sp. WM6349]KOV50551.1 hypothetical protein ADK98_08705 [Streptomyces sp. H036]OOQ54024.1 hypothetical protein AFM16_05330 [Streptomyces antibioticus]